MAPQEGPVKRKLDDEHNMPPRNIKPRKRPHNFSSKLNNIQK